MQRLKVFRVIGVCVLVVVKMASELSGNINQWGFQWLWIRWRFYMRVTGYWEFLWFCVQ